ncbi:MAG: hypothetical protein IT458_08160 [Planctomycetes bacterium]|nr:hypothetical protein [Planctomycetota bacterium]
MSTRLPLAVLTFLLLALPACKTAAGATPDEKRQNIVQLRDDTLTDLYAKEPDAREKIAKAAGYAVFSNVNITFFFVTGGGGYGVVTDNATGERTYMRMGLGGPALGIGGRNFRLVLVFPTQEALKRFTESGWEFGGQADATVKGGGDEGGSVGGRTSANSLEVYQLTDSGVLAAVALTGTRYWRDEELSPSPAKEASATQPAAK